MGYSRGQAVSMSPELCCSQIDALTLPRLRLVGFRCHIACMREALYLETPMQFLFE